MQGEKLLNDRAPKWIAYLLPWVQWLHVYNFFAGMTLGYVVILLIDAYFILHSIKVGVFQVSKKDSFLLIFALFATVTLPFAMLLEDEVLMFSIFKRCVQMFLLYITILFVNTGKIDWQAYVKSLAILSFVACGVLLVQFIMQTTMGQYYDFKLPFLEYSTTEAADRLSGGITAGARYRSIFTEPSHFIFFIFQYLVIVMFGEDRHHWKTLVTIIVISICVLLSASSTGLILLIAVWAIYMFLFCKGRKISLGLIFLGICIVLILAAGVYIYINNENLSFSFLRLTSDYERSTTVWKRLYVNFDKVGELSGLSLLIGHGMGNVKDEFMNSIVYMLLNVGCLGTLLIFAWQISYFGRSTLRGKMAILILIALSTIDTVLFMPTVMGYVTIAAYSVKDKTIPQKTNLSTKERITDGTKFRP